jgi:hypothetical protein
MLGGPPHITCAPPPGVGDAAHDISPPLDDRLVLEPESRIFGEEFGLVFPSSRGNWFTLPAHKHLLDATSQTAPNDLLRFWDNRAMMNRR